MKKNLSCPMNDKYTRYAINKYGVSSAVRIWKENGDQWSEELIEEVDAEENQIPTQDQRNSRTYVDVTAAKLQEMVAVLEAEADLYEYMAAKNPNLPGLAKKKDYLKNLLQKLIGAKDELKVMMFISHVQQTLNNSIKTIDTIRQKGNSSENMHLMMRLLREAQNLDMLDSLELHFDKNTEEGQKVIKELADIRELNAAIQSSSISMLKEMIIDHLVNMEHTEGKMRHLMLAERDFNKNHKQSYPKELQRKEKEKFIQRYMEDNASLIKLEDIDYYTKYMEVIPMDVDSIQRHLNNASHIDNELFTILREAVMTKDQVAKINMNNATRTAEELFNKVKHKLPKGNAFEMYKPFMKEIEGEWYIYEPVIVNSPHIKETAHIREDADMLALYNFIYNSLAEADKKYTSAGKLKSKKGMKIPALTKDSYKKLMEGGLSGLVSTIKEIPQLTSKFADQDLAGSGTEVFTDATGKKITGVPIYMREKLEKEERNFDLLTLTLMNSYNADIFQNRLEYRDLFDAVLYTLEDPSTKVVDKGYGSRRRPLVSRNKDADGNETKEKVVKDAVHSDLYSLIKSYKEKAVYGQGLKGTPTQVALTQKLSMYTSMVNLAFSVVANIANSMNNMSQVMLATMTDGNLITNKDTKYGSIAYHKHIAGVLKDGVENKTPKSFLGTLLELYDPGSEFVDIAFKSEYDGSTTSRHLNTGTTFILQRIVDNPAYGITMLSYLHNIKVTDASGNYVDKNGNVVKDKDDALSLAEAYENSFEGNLKLPDFVKGTDRLGVDSNMSTNSFTPEYVVKMIRPLQSLAENRFGSYSSKNKADFQKTILGHLVMGQRGFLAPLMTTRWRGLPLLWDKQRLSEMGFDKRTYDKVTGITDEGTYTIGLKVLVDMGRSIKREGILNARKSALNELTDHELGKFRRMQVEVGLLMALAILASLLFAAGEEDDDELLYMTAFYTRRLYSELRAPSDPVEFFKYFTQPAVSTTSLQKVYSIFDQFYNDVTNWEIEKYNTGENKDKAKIYNKIAKATPIWSQFARSYDYKKKYQYLINLAE